MPESAKSQRNESFSGLVQLFIAAFYFSVQKLTRRVFIQILIIEISIKVGDFEILKKLSTSEFVRIFGSIPPFLAILTSLLKFTVCEPRPNFLARCFMGQNESALPDNEYGLMVLNNTVSFNINDCPNPNQIKVQKGLLSFPSGKSS